MVSESNTEEVRRQIHQTSQTLGHDGFAYIYIQDGRLRIIGDISLSALAPLFLDILTKKMMGK